MRDVLVKTYNLGSLSADKQDVILEQIGSLIFQAILIRVIPMLSDAKQTEFEELLSADATPDSLLSFLNKEVPNFTEIMGEEAANFKKENDAIMSKIGE